MKKVIYFTNITVETHFRGKTWNTPQIVSGIVASGTDEDIKNDPLVLSRVVSKMFGKNKAKKYDYGKIRILEVERIKTLGLGFPGMEKSK